MSDHYTTIAAWVYDPTKAIFGDKNDHAARFKIDCQNPHGCDFYTKSNTCILTSALSGCKFGRKTKLDGPTRKARNFHFWMAEQRKQFAEFIDKLTTNSAWKRIARVNGHYYLPYSFMAKGLGTGNPLDSEWVPEADMTAELLERICAAQPRAVFGGVITDYQKKEVPKFLSDLRMFFPDLFALLSDDNKKRAASVSSVGRRADITTCLPGIYIFSNKQWSWDGKVLTGTSMLFQPVKGAITITIIPERGQDVKITDDSQVGPETVFLD